MEVRLSREMRLMDITMIGVGAMIGAGIFVLTGLAAGVAGPALLLVFLLNGVVALLTAMTYAELGSAFHDAGGGYLWVKTSLPDPNGFLSGWMSWFAHAVACSLYALGFGAYFGYALDFLGVPEVHPGFMPMDKWLAVLVCVLFAYVNFRGASETGKAGNVVTVGKVVVILAFVAVGLAVMFGKPDWQASFTPFMTSGWTGVFAAMGLTFIAFEGYEIIAQTSEEVEDPRKNVPRAVFLSLLIVVPIYLLVAAVAVGAVTPPAGMRVSDYLGQEKETALVTAAGQFVAGGGIVILIGGLLSTLSALNATIYSSSRVAFAMARDANLPKPLGWVHPRRATPHIAILFSAAIVIAMAVGLPIEDVAAASDIMFLLLFVQVNVAAIRLRKLRPDLDRGFHIPLMPFVPIIAIVAMAFLAIVLLHEYPKSLLVTGVWLLAGAGVYYGYSRKHEAEHVERESWMERIERKDYRVLVAVSNRRNIESLMEVGVALAARHGGELAVVAVAEVAEGRPLMAGRRRSRELEPVLQTAVEFAKGKGVEVQPIVTIARRASRGILETARQEKCNLLVLGGPTRRSLLERMLPSAVERILMEAPCQVAVVYGRVRDDTVSGIAVPVTSGGNAELAAELAPVFAERYGGPVRAITVIEKGTEKADADKMIEEARKTLQAGGLDERLEVLRRREAAHGLARAMKKGELVLMGAPRSGSVAELLSDSVPVTIVKMNRNPMVVVRDVVERKHSAFERLLFGRS